MKLQIVFPSGKEYFLKSVLYLFTMFIQDMGDVCLVNFVQKIQPQLDVNICVLRLYYMFDRKDKREPRALRHEIGQEKCKIYQRSQSSLTPQEANTLANTRVVPSPAISRELSVSRLNASRKVSQGQEKRSQERLKVVGKEEKNSYLVKARTNTPKFSQGYRIIKLQTTSKLKLQGEPPRKQEEQQPRAQKEQAHFLPVEYYLMEDEDPQALMDRYSIKQSGYVLGYSRWYDLNGASSWRKCRVLGFSQAVQRWEIEWLHNNRRKEVSRINLCFQGENRSSFDRKVASAHHYRKLSEIYYRYNNEINEIVSTTHELSLTQIERIVKKISNVPIPRTEVLINQLKHFYTRSNHQAEFNATLPFRADKIKEFRGYLPDCLFQSGEQYKIRYQISPRPLLAVRDIAYFQASKATFIEKTSLNSGWRLKTLEAINNLEEQLKNEAFILWRQDRVYQIDDLLRSWGERIDALIRVVHHSICEVQHHMGNELDNLYLEKKSKAELFESSVTRYSRFLSMITQRIETLIRKMLIYTLKELSRLFGIVSAHENSLTISLILHKKEEKIYFEIPPLQIKQKLNDFIDHLFQELSNLNCPTKSYISEIRPRNLMRVLDELGQNGSEQRSVEIFAEKARTYEAFSEGTGELNVFCSQVGEVAQQMTLISSEIKKQMQKKYSFAEIGNVVAQTKQLETRLGRLINPNTEGGGVRIACFDVKVEQVMGKMKRIAIEVKRELYKVVLEKIMKDNEKIERLISGLFERLEKPPTNIIEMLALEKLLREQANEEMEKIYSKIREIPKKVAVLESIDYLEYKDYEACNKVYVMPMKLKQELARVRRELEGTHRKKFGEELNKDATRVLQATRECGESLLGCLKIESLDEMCEKFMQFSNLNDRLAAGAKEAALINEREEAMNWARTDFSKLHQLRDEFVPHFSLVSYAKGYQVHLELLSVGPFAQIDYSKLEQELGEATRDLKGIKDVFIRNPKMLRITSEVLDRYSQYSENLPLIKALRNPDLRERHWLSIREILVLDPLEESTSLKALLNSGAKFQLTQLEEVSSIASRELHFEKKLLRLKRDWKEVKFLLSPEGQGLRLVCNLNELRQRVQGDILQVQEILSASFIKFLQTEIICWRNQVLYRAYELLEKWQQVQNEVSLVAAIFGKLKARDQLPGEHIRFQILEKIWRGLLAQIDAQPWLSDILQGKAYDYLNSLENSVSRMKKNLSSFFEDKKREYARLACISDDEFMSLLSCDQKDTKQNAVFEQTVRKCFQNIRTLVRNQRHEIVKIRTRSNEEIPLKEMTYVEKLVEYILPNDLIMQLQKKIQKQLRSSLESIGQSPSITITQILLFYHRLNFTLSVEEELIANHCISAGYLRKLEMEKEELVSSVLDHLPNMKSQSELLQALYHLQTATSLWQHSYLDLHSFAWLSQPRTYLKNDNYQVEVGILLHPYGFEITDLDDVVTQEWSARVFCSIAGAIRERGFCMVEAGPSTGKTASIKKLAALFGHKEFIFDSHPLVSPRNLLEYVRMASSGMWVVLRNLQRLAQPQLSLLSRNIEVTWFQSMAQPRQPFSIQGTGITFKVSYLKMFATAQRILPGACSLQRGILDYFRVVFLPLMNIEYVVEVKLLVLGLCEVSARRICAIVEYLKERLAFQSQLSVEFSEIYLVNKLFSFIPKDTVKQGNEHDAVVNHAFILIVDELVREQSKRNPLKSSLLQVFKIRQQPEAEQQQPYKQEFNSARLYYNQNLVQAYQLLNQLISSKNFMVVIGPPYSGKSKMVGMLQDSGKMELTCICPNAYEVQQLYGSEKTNGIICSLIEELLGLLKNEPSRRRALYLDGELGEWVQPLGGVLSSGHIIQPNGNTLLIHEQLKFIIECQSISSAPPSLALNAALIVINQPIKWQNLFNHYLATRISPKYRVPNLTKFLELFIPYIVDPIIEFYESNCGEYKGSKAHCYIPPNCIILSLLQLSETFFDAHFIDRPIEQLNEKICSDVFNLFVLAIIWTVGGSLPEQIRKSFSRHFKYLIKRAVQVNIQGVSRESLPEEEQDLFKITYHNDKWIYWNQSFLHSSVVSPKCIFLQRPEDIGLAYVIERYLNKTQSFFLLGVPSSQKVAFLESILARLSPEVYNIQRTNFNPNSKIALLKSLILRQMSNSKYSHDFKGFVHGKKTVFFVRDLSMPLVKSQSSYKSGLLEFIRHYYVTNGWFLKQSARQFYFKSLIFCATVNIHQPLPENLLKHGSSGFRVSNKEDLSSALLVLFNDSPLKPATELVVSLIGNLHHAVSRELSGISIVNFETGHAMRVAQALIRMGNCQKNQLLRRWILLSEKVYQEQLMSDQSERLFYLINNVLMEEQKLRYKTIRPIPGKYEAYFPIQSNFICVGIRQLRKQVERRCREAIIGVKEKQQRKQSKILQFALELSYNVSQLSRHLTPAKQLRFPCLKDSFVRLISHLYSTILLQISYILAISIESSFSFLDLQECLQIVAVLRNAKLVCIRLKDESWNNSRNGTWKDIVLGLIEQILSSLERSDEIKQIIILIIDFSSTNDYILDDLMDMKRMKILPFEREVKIMLEYFLDHCKVGGISQRKEESGEENWAYQSKAKMKERKYEMERKEREKRLRALETGIIDRLKFVVSLTADGLQKIKKSKLIEEYSDELSEFSVLNLNNFTQQSATSERNWRQQHQQPSIPDIKSKTIITELQNVEEPEQSMQEEDSNNGSICAGEGAQMIIQHLTQKMTSKFCFSPEDQWLRSKQASLKALYSSVKQRLLKLCAAKSELLSERIKKCMQLQDLFLVIQSQSERVALQTQIILDSMQKAVKQNQERACEYEMAQNSNRNIERKLQELSQEKEEIKLIYERGISIARDQFEREKQRLLEVLKQCKDKKVVAVNIALRILFQALGIIVEKVVKPDEELYKEVIKDLQGGAHKISKKILALCSTGNFTIPERVVIKIKELLAEIEKGKQQRRLRLEELEKEDSIIGKLFRHLFAFCNRVVEFYNTASLKQIKECLRRMSDNERTIEKLRENLAKNLKSKEYLMILQRYQEGKRKQSQFQKERLKMKTIENICTKLKDKVGKLPNIQKCENFNCALGHSGCSYLCSIVKGYDEAKQKIKEIEEEVESFAFTVAITLYYKVESCQHEIYNIIMDFDRYRSTQTSYNNIQFISDQLGSLQIIGMFEQIATKQSTSKSEYTKALMASRKFLQSNFQQKQLLPLIQFAPGIFVMGEKSNNSINNTSLKESEWIFKDFVVSSAQLAGWLRNRTGQSYHKVCLSSRVILSGKGFPRSARSIVIEEDELEASSQRMGIVLVESREQLKSLMNVLRREPLGKDITVLLVISNSSLPFEQRIFSLPAPNSEQASNFGKKIESLLLNYSDKTQASYISQLADANNQKQQCHIKIDYMLDSLNQQSLNQLFTALKQQDYQQLQRFHAFFKVSSKSSKDLSESKTSKAVKQLVSWLEQMVDDTQELYQTILRLQAIKKQEIDKRKSAGLNDRIASFLARILSILLNLQSEGLITKSLSTQRYISIIGQIFEHNKDLCKKNPIRAISQLKMLLWNLVAFLFPNHLSMVRFAFIVAEQEFLPYEDSVIAKLITLVYRNRSEAIFEQSLLGEGADYMVLYFPQKAEFQDSQQAVMGERMRRKVREIERYLDKHGLQVSFQSNLKEWISFARRIDHQTSKIPSYLIGNSNILLFAYFLSIFNPNSLQQWISQMDNEGYFKNQQLVCFLSDQKKGQIKLSEISYSNQWGQLSNLIQYHLYARSTNHLLLLSAAPLDVIESTSCFKVALSYFDASTFLWQLEKLREMKDAQDYEQVRDVQQAPAEDGQREKELISSAEMYRNNLKNQGLIIINLKHWVSHAISPIAYFQKIQKLFCLLLQQCPVSNIYSELKSAKVSSFSSKAIIVYVLDSFVEYPQNLINRFQGLKNNYILYEPIKHNNQIEFSNHRLRLSYYQSIFRSGKNRRQYERLPFSSKAILYSFLFLAEKALYEMRSKEQRARMEKLSSKIEGCIMVIRQLNLLGEKQEQLLSRWCDWGVQRGWSESEQRQLDCIILRLEQYTLLVIEYCIELNYKTSLIDKRLRSTLEYLIEIQDIRSTLANLQLSQINTLLEDEISSYEQIKSDQLLSKLWRFSEQGLALTLEEGQKEPSFKEQEEKLIHVFLQESRLEFNEKLKEIEGFSLQSFNQLKVFVDRLKIYDVKRLHELYRQLATQIEAISNLQAKYAAASCKSNSSQAQPNTSNALITNAITDLFNKHATHRSESEHSEIALLQEVLLSSLVSHKKKIISTTRFLDELREILKDFIQIQLHKGEQIHSEELSEISDDSQENIRQFQQQQIRSLIKRKIQMKILSERLIKKISSLRRKFGENLHRSLAFKDQKIIFQATALTQENYILLEQESKDHLHNYQHFENQYKQKSIGISEGFEVEAAVSRFTFNFNHHSLSTIIHILRAHHSRKFHQQYHNLTYTMTLLPYRKQSGFSTTQSYFRGVKLFNATYEVREEMIYLQPAEGVITMCEDLLVQVAVMEQREQNSTDESEGLTIYKVPFYLRDQWEKQESRLRIQITITELLKFQLPNYNIYLTH